MRVCSTCRLEKEDEFFSWKIQGKQRNSICKDCHRKYRKQHYVYNRQKYIDKARRWEQSQGGVLAIRYKLTEEQFATMLAKYDGKCWLCRSKQAKVVDHDHSCCSGQITCGKCVRGLLCIGCNTGLGRLGDTRESLLQALNYLENCDITRHADIV